MNRTGSSRIGQGSGPRLLVLRTTRSFVSRQDEACLRRVYDVRTFDVVQSPRRAQLWNLVRLSLWLAVNLPRAVGVFFRFADYHAAPAAFFARLYRRKLWIVTAGYDSHWFPEFRYGVYSPAARAKAVRYALRHSTAILPVHESLYDGVNDYAFDPPRPVGVKHLVPGMHDRVHTIWNGFDAEFWSPDADTNRERLVVCVASIPVGAPLEARQRMSMLKGVPLILDVARELPDVRFAIIGPNAEALPPDLLPLPSNVEVTGHVTPEEVRGWYRRAHVYMHPSLTEGTPNAVAEAMLCGCVPVTSNVNGTPVLVGDTGIVLNQPDIARWREAAVDALARTTGPDARNRIRTEFSIEKRCARLLEVVRLDQ